jgi:hypothetical protein
LQPLQKLSSLHTFQLACYGRAPRQNSVEAIRTQLTTLAACSSLTELDCCRPFSCDVNQVWSRSLSDMIEYRSTHGPAPLQRCDIRGCVNADTLNQLLRLSNLQQVYHSAFSNDVDASHIVSLVKLPRLNRLCLKFVNGTRGMDPHFMSNVCEGICANAATCSLMEMYFVIVNITHGKGFSDMIAALPHLRKLDLTNCIVDTLAFVSTARQLIHFSYNLSTNSVTDVNNPWYNPWSLIETLQCGPQLKTLRIEVALYKGNRQFARSKSQLCELRDSFRVRDTKISQYVSSPSPPLFSHQAAAAAPRAGAWTRV